MARTPRHTLTIVALSLGLAAAYMLLGATAAGASPGLTVGIAGNQFIDAPEQAKASSEEIGLDGVRVFLDWHGERHVTEADRARLSHLAGTRSLISITGRKGPKTLRERGDFAAYAADVTRLFHPWMISVWNEPNLSYFWGQDGGAAEDYTRLLARTYDAVKRSDPNVQVCGGELARSYAVERFVRRMGRLYRSMHRTRKLMDGFCHHPYAHPFSSATAGNVPGYPGWIVQGDVARLRAVLESAFKGTAQKRWTPIYWSETGWFTEGEQGIADETQAARMAEAVELAHCQRRVKGIFFFQLWDDGLGEATWQTGILNHELGRKLSFYALKNAIANVNAGNVDCSRFPAASL